MLNKLKKMLQGQGSHEQSNQKAKENGDEIDACPNELHEQQQQNKPKK